MTVEGLSIAYVEAGTGVPFISLHGFYPDHRLMSGAIEPLFDAEDRAVIPPSAGGGRPGGGPTQRRYHRIYPDLPFMGASGDPAEVGTSDDMLRVMTAFIRAVAPEGGFLLAGESYGGYLARGLCRVFPGQVEGLLLLCPLIVARTVERDVHPLQAMRVERGYAGGAPTEAQEEFELVAVIRDPYTWRRTTEEVMSGVAIARSSALEALRTRGYAFSFDGLRSRTEGGDPFDVPFDCPALVVLGRQDASVGWHDALRLAERYPRATYAVLDMAGHNLQIEQAGLFQALTAEWLGRCEDAPNARRA